MKPIALQMYTLRDALEKDFAVTMKYVAEVGYKGIESAGLAGKTPAEYAQAAADLGLTITSCHGAFPTAKTLSEAVDQQGGLGTNRLVSGFGPDDLKTVEACKVAAAKMQTAAELLRPHGISVHMHNHYWELARMEDGQYALDIMLAEAPDIYSQLDVYWVTFGGADPVEILGKYGKRVELVHVKDGLVGGEYHFKALGEGQVDLPAAIGAIDQQVTQWLIVEQDLSDGNMKDDVKTSYDYLIGAGLAEGNR